MLQLCYSALSPYCRKIRMILDHMELEYEIFDSFDVEKYPSWNPRAEIPILRDGDIVVRNSATIVEYLRFRFPNSPSPFPNDPSGFSLAKEWELIADTLLDPIVTNVGIFRFGELGSPPKGWLDAAKNDIKTFYNQMERQLADRKYIVGNISVADFALYPHIAAAQKLELSLDAQNYPACARWLESMLSSKVGMLDRNEVRKWWVNRTSQDAESDRINWGTYRLEWVLAHGFLDWFKREVERGAVLWSVGPQNNAQRSPLDPKY